MTEGTAWLPEFDAEMASTRRVLERVPAGRFDFKPHEKSFSLEDLASHLANIPSWTAITLKTEELDMGQDFGPRDTSDTEALLAHFDRHVAEGRTALEKATVPDMAVPWTLRVGEQVVFTLPRGVVMRSFVMNHMIHHRAQLTVYLRLLDVPVPGVYGPSADEHQKR